MPRRTAPTDKTAAALVAAAGMLAYATAIGNAFAWDDIFLIVRNPNIRGWSHLPDIFNSGYWAATGVTGGLYRPLTMLSFMAEYSLAGLDPLLYHVDNILLHTACSLLAYIIFRKLIKEGPAPLFAAMLFAVHPVHSEAVAWVSGRAELLSALFFLLSFHTFFNPPRRVPWYIISPMLYLLGILSKETAATLPALILLYLLLVKGERNPQKLALALVPYVVVLAAYLPVRLHVLGGHVGPEQSMFGNVDAYHVVLTMFKAGFNYIRLVFLPVDLQAAYIFPPPESFLTPEVAGFAIIITALAVLTPRFVRSYPVGYLLGAWFFVALLPVSNIIPTEVIMTERAMYLPTVGACGVIGMLFAGARRHVPDKAVYAALALTVVIFAGLTLTRNTVWKDQSSIDSELLKVNERLVKDFPGKPSAYTKLGESYATAGRMSEAGPLFMKALALNPSDADAHYGLAGYYREADRMEEALSELSSAVRHGYREPDSAYVNMAAILYGHGHADESRTYLEKALAINPDNPLANLNYGYLLHDAGGIADALGYFAKAGELDPANFDAFFQQGLALGEMGLYADAAKAIEKAVGLIPGDPEVRMYLGAAYEAAGDFANARAQYEGALLIAPDYAPARTRLERLR